MHICYTVLLGPDGSAIDDQTQSTSTDDAEKHIGVAMHVAVKAEVQLLHL